MSDPLKRPVDAANHIGARLVGGLIGALVAFVVLFVLVFL